MKAVITAGGPIAGNYAERAGTHLKALAPVRGKTMLARTIEALRGVGVARIAVVGGEEVKNACGSTVEKIVPDAGTGRGNVLGALDAWPEDGDRLLYLTCDMPYVTAPALQTFVDAVPEPILSMALCEIDAFLLRFPNIPPSFGITLNGEMVVNGGAFLIPAGANARIRSFATRLFEARKTPLKMASIAGPSLLLKFLFGRLAISELEARASGLLGVPVVAARGCSPELGFDADTLTEYEYALANE
jgi:GTP:adenosylcobinamide-phosphate guanylyltransferase